MQSAPRNWLVVFLWMSGIFLLSSIPAEEIPKIPVPRISSIVHFVEYSVLGALMLRAFVRSFPSLNLLAASLLTVLLCVLYAFSDEWHQTFVPGRFYEVEDLLVDSLSSILGVLWFLRREERTGSLRKSGPQ